MTKHRRSKWLSSPQERAAVIAGVFGIIIALIGAIALNWQKAATATGAPVGSSGHYETRYSLRGHPYRIRVRDMPRIDDVLLDVIVYLYPSEAAAEDGEKLGGSGFLLGIPLPETKLCTHREDFMRLANTTAKKTSED